MRDYRPVDASRAQNRSSGVFSGANCTRRSRGREARLHARAPRPYSLRRKNLLMRRELRVTSANIAESPKMPAIHCATVGGGSSMPGRYFFRVRHEDRVIAANPVLIRLARQMREPPVAALCVAEDFIKSDRPGDVPPLAWSMCRFALRAHACAGKLCASHRET